MSNNYFIIVLLLVILLPLSPGVSEFPLFQSLLRLGWGCRNPLIPRILLHHFFCRKNVHYCSNCFIVLLFDIENFHRIFSDWGITQGVDSPEIFSQGRSKQTLRRSKGDIGATMNIFISVTPDTRCSLTCFHGHLLHAVVISPPHPFTKLRGFSRFQKSLWRVFKIKRRKKKPKKNWCQLDARDHRGDA